jgi:hypothetical protein
MLLNYFNTVNIKIHLLFENKHQLHANIINWAFKISPLVINLRVKDTTDCLGFLSETLHGQLVHKCNQEVNFIAQ